MNNLEIVTKVIEYIHEYTKKQNMSYDKIVEICSKKGCKVSKGTIKNTFATPTSVSFSSLLKICDGLEINLLEIFNHVYRTQIGEITQGKFIYDINDDAYLGYKNTFHIYFIPTSSNNRLLQHHGILHLDDMHNIGECHAHLLLDTGEKNEDGSSFIKEYMGKLVISKMGCAYINLISEKYGDMWFLIINHDYLNKKPLICTLANAVTASSGRVRFPTLHRAILSREKLDDKILPYIRGFLHLSSENIYISSEQFDKFLAEASLPEKTKEKILSMQKDSETFFAFSKKIIESSIDEYVYIIPQLINYSSAPENNQITYEEEEMVFKIINEYIGKKNKNV